MQAKRSCRKAGSSYMISSPDKGNSRALKNSPQGHVSCLMGPVGRKPRPVHLSVKESAKEAGLDDK